MCSSVSKQKCHKPSITQVLIEVPVVMHCNGMLRHAALLQERALRKQLEADCEQARDMLTERIAREESVAQRARLLAEELEKQRVEQEQVDVGIQEQVRVLLPGAGGRPS